MSHDTIYVSQYTAHATLRYDTLFNSNLDKVQSAKFSLRKELTEKNPMFSLKCTLLFLWKTAFQSHKRLDRQAKRRMKYSAYCNWIKQTPDNMWNETCKIITKIEQINYCGSIS